MGDILLQFPVELIESILENKGLSLCDLCNVAATCTKLKALIEDSQKLWKVKFQQLYPRLENIYKKSGLNNTVNWKNECKTRMLLGKHVDIELNKLINKCYMKDELAHHDYKPFMNIVHNHRVGAWLIIDHLMNLIHSELRYLNLTTKYYAEKVLRFIRQLVLTDEWQQLKLLPLKEQTLEKGAVIVAQWCQPTIDVTHENISKALDEIADIVVKEISAMTNGEHPILKVPPEKLKLWASYNIIDNQWSKTDNKIVVEAVSNILFKQMNFHGSQEFYYYPENSFINKVLEEKRGIPITLSILYESITRRLGIKCEAVSFPGHFLLRWRGNYRSCDNLVSEYSYIDVFNGGRLFSKSSCPRFENIFPSKCPMSDVFKYGPATIEEVVQRMAHNLEVANRQRTSMVGRNDRLKSVLELLHMLNPSELNSLLQLTRFYMYMNMEIIHPLQKIQNLLQITGIDRRGHGQAHHMLTELHDYQMRIEEDFQNYKMNVKNRGENCTVKYYIGMVMHHRLYNYKCVIYGWDLECKESDDWMTQMGVQNLQRKNKQPFYLVLVNDGSQRYAAEDNLRICKENCFIEHHLVGRYFDQFCGTHYVPNKIKASEYPDDIPLINMTYAII
ncbi:F-box only protein 21-like [Lycorma delicatula]|uniref:F-box only protein 21-like n=1 Tax=Lycorma delicatula TaxID=130591 RepID=UPI003F513526